MPDPTAAPPVAGPVVDAVLDDGWGVAILAVSKGDEVLYGRYAGSDVVVERKEIKILRESDILAKVVK